jgi:hypothetical protein
MDHEAIEAIVPVVVSRQGVDGLRVILIGAAEFLQVLVYIPIRIDDIAADDHKVCILPNLE